MLPVRDEAPGPGAGAHQTHKMEDLGPEEGLIGPGADPKTDSKLEAGLEGSINHPSNHKRMREGTEGDEQPGDLKRPLLDKDSALEEVLSDISDDADEILNREDSELGNVAQGERTCLPGKGSQSGNQPLGLPQQTSQSCPTGTIHPHHRRTVDGAEGVTNLGFEEISDGELEEEARARGISDALGVDWASLVAETRPRAKLEKAGGTRQRWEGVRLLTYIGVSVEYAGPKLVNYLLDAVFNPKVEADEEAGKACVDATEGESSEHSSKNTSAESSEVISKKISTSAEEQCDKSANSSNSENDNRDKPSSLSGKGKEDSVGKNAFIPEQNSISGESTVLSAGLPDTKTEVLLPMDCNKPPLNSSAVCKSEGEENKAVHKLEVADNGSKRTGDLNQSQNLFCEKLLHPVAGIHTALLERRARRQALFGGSSPYKRALSARRDLSIRRQLCSLLPRETTCDNGPAVGELFRLSVQLLERAS